MRRIRGIGWLVLLACFACKIGQADRPQGPPSQNFLHVVLAMDGFDPTLKKYVRQNATNISYIFQQIFDRPGSQLQGRVVDLGLDTPLTKYQIFEYLENKRERLGPTDSLLVIYSGHGGFDKNEGLFLSLDQLKDPPQRNGAGDFLTKDLYRRAVNTGAGLVVVLTEACANIAQLVRSRPGLPFLPESPEIIEDLFYRHRGRAVITSSTPPEYSFVTLFVDEFLRVLGQSRTRLDANHDDIVDWAEAFYVLRHGVNQKFLNMREEAGPSYEKAWNQKAQVPFALTLPPSGLGPLDHERDESFVRVSKLLNESENYRGQDGLMIHLDFEVKQKQGTRGTVIAYFTDEQGNLLRDRDGRYASSTGRVSTSEPMIVNEDLVQFRDFRLFIPYSQLDGLIATEGVRYPRFYVEFYDSQGKIGGTQKVMFMTAPEWIGRHLRNW